MHSISSRRTHLALAASLTAIAAAAVPTAAQAQDSGLYVTGRVGVSLPSDFDLEGVQEPQSPSPGVSGAPAEVESQLGDEFTFSGAIGYRIGTRVFDLFEPSIELEYSNISADVSSGSFNGGNQTFLGEVDVQSFTVNYQSDLVWSDNQKVIPFIGGGIGIADVDADVLYFPGTATAPTFGATGSNTAFTLQSNVGVRFELSETISVDARARYQQVNGIDLERRFIGGGNDAFNADLSGDFDTVNLLVGLRYSF